MKTQTILIVIAVGGSLMVSGSARGASAYFDNFDSTAVGSPPAGWTVGGQTAAVVTNAQSVSSPNSARLYTPADFTSGSSYMYQIMGNTPTDPFSYFRENIISADVWLSSTNQYFNMQVVDAGLTAAFQLQFNQGSIKAYNGGSLLTLGTFTSNEWYHVVMATRAPTTKYSLAVYDSLNTLVASGVNFDYNVLTAPQGLFFIEFGSIGGAPVPATAYLDNVFVGQVPEPSTVALLVVGGIGVLGAYRRTKLTHL